MKPKMIITVLLVLFVAVSVAFLVFQETRGIAESADGQQKDIHTPEESGREVQSETVVSPRADVDIVYYFMTVQRCPSCMKIEAYTREAVEKNFSGELGDGRLMWRMLAVDNPENYHFIKDFQLFTKSVVLVKIRSGKQVDWKNLERVWELLGDKNAFTAYVTDEVKSFVEKG